MPPASDDDVRDRPGAGGRSSRAAAPPPAPRARGRRERVGDGRRDGGGYGDVVGEGVVGLKRGLGRPASAPLEVRRRASPRAARRVRLEPRRVPHRRPRVRLKCGRFGGKLGFAGSARKVPPIAARSPRVRAGALVAGPGRGPVEGRRVLRCGRSASTGEGSAPASVASASVSARRSRSCRPCGRTSGSAIRASRPPYHSPRHSRLADPSVRDRRLGSAASRAASPKGASGWSGGRRTEPCGRMPWARPRPQSGNRTAGPASGGLGDQVGGVVAGDARRHHRTRLASRRSGGVKSSVRPSPSRSTRTWRSRPRSAARWAAKRSALFARSRSARGLDERLVELRHARRRGALARREREDVEEGQPAIVDMARLFSNIASVSVGKPR